MDSGRATLNRVTALRRMTMWNIWAIVCFLLLAEAAIPLVRLADAPVWPLFPVALALAAVWIGRLVRLWRLTKHRTGPK